MSTTDPSPLAETGAKPEPDMSMSLNALKCVRPSDEFAADVGREVIAALMRDGHPKVDPLAPFKRLTIEVKCS